jgi:hypothetical protein
MGRCQAQKVVTKEPRLPMRPLANMRARGK